MSSLIFLREVLSEQEWAFEEHPKLPVVRVEIETASGSWELYVEFREEAQQLLTYSVYCLELTPERRVSLAEMLHRINCDLVIGCFELDYEADAVRMRMSADMATTAPSRALLERLVIGNTLMMELHLASINAVATGAMSASEAMAAAASLD